MVRATRRDAAFERSGRTGPVAPITRGLPEYEARSGTGGSELCLTMLRSVGVISRASGVIATRPLSAGPQLATPEGQCLGRHVLEYALRLDGDELDDVSLLRDSQDYRSPFLVVASEVQFDAPLRVEGDVVFSCLKGAEDSDALIMRPFNPDPRRPPRGCWGRWRPSGCGSMSPTDRRSQTESSRSVRVRSRRCASVRLPASDGEAAQ